MLDPFDLVHFADTNKTAMAAVDCRNLQYQGSCPKRMAWSKVVRFFSTVASGHKWGRAPVSGPLQEHRAGTLLSCERHPGKHPQVPALRIVGKDARHLFKVSIAARLRYAPGIITHKDSETEQNILDNQRKE